MGPLGREAATSRLYIPLLYLALDIRKTHSSFTNRPRPQRRGSLVHQEDLEPESFIGYQAILGATYF